MTEAVASLSEGEATCSRRIEGPARYIEVDIHGQSSALNPSTTATTRLEASKSPFSGNHLTGQRDIFPADLKKNC